MEKLNKSSVEHDEDPPTPEETDETNDVHDETQQYGEDETEFEGLGLQEKIDWSKLKTIFRYRPKTVDEEGKLTEEDIYNIMRENKTNPYLAAMLASMSLTVCISSFLPLFKIKIFFTTRRLTRTRAAA